MSDSVRPHRWQPTRLSPPWDSPGKNTAVGCHFLLQCMDMKSESELADSCPTVSDPLDCSLPGSSVHGIFQARIGCHALLQGNLPNPGTKPRSPALLADPLPSESPGRPKNAGAGSPSLLQGIFPTQEENWGLLLCRQILYQLYY